VGVCSALRARASISRAIREVLRMNELVEGFVEPLISRPSRHTLEVRIERGQAGLRGDREDHVRGSLDERLVEMFGFAKRFLRVLALTQAEHAVIPPQVFLLGLSTAARPG